MKYGPKDIVLYGADGVCMISEVTERKVGGDTMQYYILKPLYDEKSTIFVPLSNQKLLGKMKNVASRDEIYSVLSAANDAEPGWIDNDAERKDAFHDAIEDGNFEGLVKIFCEINVHRKLQQRKGKRLHVSDERTLKEVEKMLYDELSLVLNIKRGKVKDFLSERLGV